MSSKRKLLVALAVFLIVFGGLAYWLWRGTPAKYTTDQLSGTDPVIAEPQKEEVPSVSVAPPVGWASGEAPVAAQGLSVGRFAEGLDHPRVIYTLPNGDVLVSETGAPASNMGGGVTGWIAGLIMGRAGATGPSPDTLMLLRDADGDGRAEGRFVLRKGNGLVSPSGLAWRDDKLYVANHDGVLVFGYKLGETALAGAPEKLMDLPGGGNHWMRNLLLSPDGRKLYAAVGSASNIGENGMGIEQGRATIWEVDLAEKRPHPFAQGLRNPNGLAWNPSTGELWTTVNERDQLGPDLVPDYLTNVPIGAHYGWPWIYYKVHNDDRVVAQPPEFIDDFVRKPEYALGAHVAALGLAFAEGGHRLGASYANGAFIARHGSWNRTPPAGYDVVFVAFDANGGPLGKPLPVLTGFLTGNGSTHGRPTWLAFDHGGGLLVSDDTAGIIWRVIAPGAAPSVAPAAVRAGRLPPQRQLNRELERRYSAGFKADENVAQ
jgi:glucose/arabinose dehydrogenase